MTGFLHLILLHFYELNHIGQLIIASDDCIFDKSRQLHQSENHIIQFPWPIFITLQPVGRIQKRLDYHQVGQDTPA